MPISKNFRVVTLSNAQRLLADSVLLADNDRVESAIILAVFAIEEFGKYLIECWGVKNEGSNRKYPSHIEKQSATFVVLYAREIVKMSPKKFRKMHSSPDQRIRSWGPYAEQLQWSKAGFYDDLRMVATYADKESKWPEEVTDDVSDFPIKELHKYFGQALITSRDKKSMKLAAIIYKNGLGDL